MVGSGRILVAQVAHSNAPGSRTLDDDDCNVNVVVHHRRKRVKIHFGYWQATAEVGSRRPKRWVVLPASRASPVDPVEMRRNSLGAACVVEPGQWVAFVS